MVDTLLQLIVIIAILVVAWLIIARFSPDPLITKICQIIIFILALFVVVQKLLPLVGVG